MEDREAIEAFIDGAPAAAGPALHTEEDALLYAGWWHCLVRLGNNSFIVRVDPEDDAGASVVELIKEVLEGRGVKRIPGEHSLILAITYVELSTAGGEWELWAPDPFIGELALTARAGAESPFRSLTAEDATVVEGLSSQLEGARRIAGLPPSVVVVVGLERDQVFALEASMPECRFEARDLGGIAPDACSDLSPTLILVNAVAQPGRDFIMELRAAACGRFLPVAAVIDQVEPPLGADIALDPGLPPPVWRDQLIALLPD